MNIDIVWSELIRFQNRSKNSLPGFDNFVWLISGIEMNFYLVKIARFRCKMKIFSTEMVLKIELALDVAVLLAALHCLKKYYFTT